MAHLQRAKALGHPWCKGLRGKEKAQKTSQDVLKFFRADYLSYPFLVILITLVQGAVTEIAFAQALPAELKMSLYVRVPQNTSVPNSPLEVVGVGTSVSVTVQSYLLAPGSSPSSPTADQLCVLAKREQSVSIVSGSMNLSFGTGIDNEDVTSCGSATYCGLGSTPPTYVFSGLTGTTAQAKWLQALYGTSTGSLSNVEAFSGTSFSGDVQTGVSCQVTSSQRYWGVMFSVNNKAGQTVPLRFLVKLGAAPYAGIAAQVAPGSITTSSLQDGVITQDKLQNGSVTENKIVDGAVTTAKLASGAITGAKIGAGVVTGTHISDDSITEAKIANNAVSTNKLQNGAVTTDKVAGISISKILGPLSPASCVLGQVLKYNPALNSGQGGFECAAASGAGVESDPTVQAFAKTSPADGLEVNGSNQLKVKINSSQFEFVSGELQIKGEGVDTVQIKNGAVTDSKISGVSWSKINSKPTDIQGYGITDAVKNAGDVLSLQSGEESNRPSGSAVQKGQVYIATDSQKIYWYDGSNWIAVGGTGNASDLTTGTINGALLPNFSGDVSGAYNALQVTKIHGKDVAAPSDTASNDANKLLGFNSSGSGFEYKSLTAGSGVNITHSAGGIEISSTVSSATPSGAAGGDLGGTYPNPEVHKIRGLNVPSPTLSQDGLFLRYDHNVSEGNPRLVWSGVKLSELKNASGTGSAFNVTACSASQTLVWSSITDQFSCTNITGLPSSAINDLAIVTSKIADLAVTNAKLADNSISTAKIQNESVTSDKLSPISGLLAGWYTKVQLDTKGRVTAGGALTESDIPALPASKIQAGTLDLDRLPASVKKWQVQGADLKYSDGNIILGEQTTAQARLDVDGSIKIGSDNQLCNSSRIGALKFDNDYLFVCTSNGWRVANLLAPQADVVHFSGDGSNMDVTGPGSPAFGPTRSFVFKNQGAMASAPISVSLTNTTHFEIVSNGCQGVSLNPGQSCTVQVRSKATENGTLAGVLNVTW